MGWVEGVYVEFIHLYLFVCVFFFGMVLLPFLLLILIATQLCRSKAYNIFSLLRFYLDFSQLY